GIFGENSFVNRAGICLNLIGSFDRFRCDPSRFQRLRHVLGYF
ncbi:hypothetical protein LINPERHAP1_LOCUS5794, partial [Linum perenne]